LNGSALHIAYYDLNQALLLTEDWHIRRARRTQPEESTGRSIAALPGSFRKQAKEQRRFGQQADAGK
jgi:hypothetical protein